MPSYDYVVLAVGLTVALMIGAIAGAGIGYITGLQNAQVSELMKDAAPKDAATNTYDMQPMVKPAPTPEPTPTPEPSKTYVTCGEYFKVVDKWKTPSGSFVKLDDNRTVLLVPQFTTTDYKGIPITYGDDYGNIIVGDYAKPTPSTYDYFAGLIRGRTFKLNPVSEAESGYCDACEVVK